MLKLNSLIKKKILEDEFSYRFIETIDSSCENTFEDLIKIIEIDSCFISNPIFNIQDDIYKFKFLILCLNINNLKNYYNNMEFDSINYWILYFYSQKYNVKLSLISENFKEYNEKIIFLNYPLKNYTMGIAKAFVDIFSLYMHQDEYFKKQKLSNPMFLRKLSELIEKYKIDILSFKNNYKIIKKYPDYQYNF